MLPSTTEIVGTLNHVVHGFNNLGKEVEDLKKLKEEIIKQRLLK